MPSSKHASSAMNPDSGHSRCLADTGGVDAHSRSSSEASFPGTRPANVDFQKFQFKAALGGENYRSSPPLAAGTGALGSPRDGSPDLSVVELPTGQCWSPIQHRRALEALDEYQRVEQRITSLLMRLDEQRIRVAQDCDRLSQRCNRLEANLLELQALGTSEAGQDTGRKRNPLRSQANGDVFAEDNLLPPYNEDLSLALDSDGDSDGDGASEADSDGAYEDTGSPDPSKPSKTHSRPGIVVRQLTRSSFQGGAAGPPSNGKVSSPSRFLVDSVQKLLDQNDYVEAVETLRNILASSEYRMQEPTLRAVNRMTSELEKRGDYRNAEYFLREALDLNRAFYGERHVDTHHAVIALYDCLCKVGKDWDAKKMEGRLEEATNALNKSKARVSFQGQLLLQTVNAENSEREKMIIISDPGQDNDDEMAMLLLMELSRLNEVEPLAVVANLRPSDRRAALARGTLDMLGMQHVLVGIGTDGGSTKHTDTFSKYITEGKTGIDYIKEPLEAVARVLDAIGTGNEYDICKNERIFHGQHLMTDLLRKAEPRSVTLLLISSLKDAADLLRNDEVLFKAKIKCVTIMGGMKAPEPREEGAIEANEDDGGLVVMQPTDAHNNEFDRDASVYFYTRCQELGIPLVVLSRFAAYGCPVQKKVYDLMVRCPVPNPTLCRLQRAQRVSIETLWTNVCTGGILPPRCDKKWFCDTFCSGEGTDRTPSDSMWDLVKTFNMYDPLALLAALPARRNFFFEPVHHIGPHGIVHLNIGVSQEQNGIGNVADLHDFLMTTWIRAAGRPRYGDTARIGEELRPKELDEEQLTAALTAMPPHAPEELRKLNENVLRLINEEWPKLKNSSLLGTWQDRDRLMKEIGPAMLLVDPYTVKNLGRIPHSAENKGITMEQAAALAEKEGGRFFIEMFSHRWHSRYAPDDRYNNKARVLCEWADYRWKSQRFRTFFWIDYTCIDQSDIAPGVAMLPLYVSCCNNIVCYDTPPYEPRAWCRVERLMFTSFVAPNTEYVDPDFVYNEDAPKMPNGELKPTTERKEVVPDPAGADAQLSYPADSELIAELKNLCTQHWAKCWKEGLIDIVEEKVGLRSVRQLTYGVTEFRLRKFS